MILDNHWIIESCADKLRKVVRIICQKVFFIHFITLLDFIWPHIDFIDQDGGKVASFDVKFKNLELI